MDTRETTTLAFDVHSLSGPRPGEVGPKYIICRACFGFVHAADALDIDVLWSPHSAKRSAYLSAVCAHHCEPGATDCARSYSLLSTYASPGSNPESSNGHS